MLQIPKGEIPDINMSALLFFIFGGLAIGCAISMVAQRNPLYSAVSLIGVLIALACLYVTLAAPFIAAVQVIVYAGAIMVLVVFVIMLLNVEEEQRPSLRLHYLVPTAIVFAGILVAEAAFIFYFVNQSTTDTGRGLSESNVGLTASIGRGLFTIYLLPFEITSILLLMAIVGAMSLARRPLGMPAETRGRAMRLGNVQALRQSGSYGAGDNAGEAGSLSVTSEIPGLDGKPAVQE